MTTSTPLKSLVHPGIRAQQRLESVATGTVVERVSLSPGRRLIDAIDEALRDLGADSAQVELLGGPLARVSYCIPALCADGSRAAWYSETFEAVVPATIVAGSATVGRRGGDRFMHCHAAWFGADGALRGGHLWPDTVVGSTPVEVILHAFDSVALTSGDDDETMMPVFTPTPVPELISSSRRAVMTRVRPGVELHDAVRRIMLRAGMQSASVRGSLGSLVGATLIRDGGNLVIDGPATEVTIAGHADSSGDHHLSVFAIDRHGGVHTGELAEHGNLVAVTFELLLEEISE